jgi:para-aminobenzoate synthetase/4-amino-4-deoxychorismate lyase
VRGPTTGAPAPRGLPPRALTHATRPEPAHGVFETLLAQDGRPQFLLAHLERLAASADILYGATLPDDLAARVGVAGAGLTRGRIRVVLQPNGALAIAAQPEPAPDRRAPALVLAPWLLPGGLGAHKWSDRRLQSALGAAMPATVPLFVDGDGAVLEAGYANVWIVEGDQWITPPADGRILPGVTRALMLANPGLRAREGSFDLARLAAADAVFLTSSVSGRRRATLASRS